MNDILAFLKTQGIVPNSLHEAYLIYKATMKAQGWGCIAHVPKWARQRKQGSIYLRRDIPRRHLLIEYVEVVMPNPQLEALNQILNPR